MTRVVFALATMLISAPASGQSIAGGTVDPAPIAAANAKADAALATAQAAQQSATSTAAALPSTCTQPPAPDAMAATAGTGTPCTPRIDAARQTPIPPALATTLADGSFSGTWGMTLAAPPSRAIATIEGANPRHCQIITKTAAGFTGKCWDIAPSITLDTVLTSLLGSVKTILSTSAAGQTVTILARQ